MFDSFVPHSANFEGPATGRGERTWVVAQMSLLGVRQGQAPGKHLDSRALDPEADPHWHMPQWRTWVNIIAMEDMVNKVRTRK